MAYVIEVVRGDTLTWTLTLERDGDPWTDIEDFDPTAQIRQKANTGTIAATPTVTVDGAVITFELTDTQTKAFGFREYEWDVEFTDPDSGAVFTWPPAPDARAVLRVTADVTRVVSA